ncbi:hypothetical protein BJX76DRAFT_356281 [Aspergillus varians]
MDPLPHLLLDDWGEPYYWTYPMCYICGSVVDDEGNPRLTPGIYAGEKNMTDRRFWRDNVAVLSHPQKRICHLSGTAYFLADDIGSLTLQVPWDEDTGFIRGDSSTDQSLLATVVYYEKKYKEKESPPKNRLTGFLVHTQCWEVLRAHRIWTLAEQRLEVVLDAMYRKRIVDFVKPDNPLEDHFSDQAWPMGTDNADPFYSERAQRIIRQARRMTQKRFKVVRRRKNMNMLLHRLPAEILLLVADHLPGDDVAAIQKAMGWYLGDVYWRSRIPTDLFHEVKDLFGEKLDWEFLCLELEKFDAYHDHELQGRKWVLEQLDGIAVLISQ